MKNILLFAFFFFSASTGFSQENKPRNFTVTDEFSSVVNNTAYQKKNISITAENGDVTYKSLQDLEEELALAAKLYKSKQYAKAHPMIAELSQWGVKEAQAILGGMYIKGEHVDKSTDRGLAWLGVAKEAGTEKSAAKMYKYVYKQLNEPQQKYMDQRVASYIQMYGSEAQNFTCKKRRSASSNIPETRCIKALGSNSVLYPIE